MEAVPFGEKDPLFGLDIGFYVFSLPIYSLILGIAKFLCLLALIGCGIIYILRGKLNLSELLAKFNLSNMSGKNGHSLLKPDRSKITDPGARLHIAILLFLFIALVAIGTQLSLYDLLTAQSGPVSGATFTDANVMIPLIHISVIVYIVAALMALFYGISGKLSPLFGTIFLVFLIGAATAIIPSIFQRLIVAPNELVKETPFIKHNIAATRQAYSLENIEKRGINSDKPLTAADIAANNLTIKNVRLWDRDPLLSTFSQIQEIRTYYEFASVDNDRYTLNGEIRQIMLSPRELAAESLPNKNWINEHLTFTHGYGITAGPVNQVTPEGLPVLFVKDLPPKSTVKELDVKRPEIYFGELANDFIIVKSNSKEFDYPKGEENVYSDYKGSGGVQIDSLLKRLFFTLHFSSMKIFLSGDVTSASRILYNREIKKRVAKIAPFLTYDRDPYLVVAEGKLYWIVDAYTSSDRYPYSQPLSLQDNDVNYIRNSVKAVVDAYDGKVTLYLADPDDPIIKTYAKIFPKTFRPISQMPKSLMSHVRYPEDIFTLQTAIYTTYHMEDPQIFYNKEDQWEIPSIAQEQPDSAVSEGESASVMSPRHMIMRLPGEKEEEFILMLPFTPRSKDNLSAWMVARNDEGKYGKLVVYSFPKDKLIFGPKQVIGRISQDAEVSRQISLWDQRGSQVIQGTLLVIPIENSLVYVRPLYLKAETGKIPELKRVIVAYENKIAMEATLEQGLAKIFGAPSTDTTSGQPQPTPPAGGPTSPTPTPTASTDSTADESTLLQQANEAYESALNAQREGDWAKYGQEISRLGDILEQLR